MTTQDDLSLVEAATLLSGADMVSTQAIAEHGIASVRMSDGPHGLAMNLPDWTGKVRATCFPSATALAATWDTPLVGRVAAAIGAEARANGAAVLLGPGLNIKRSPLGGRGFEYYSEDPVLAGHIGAAFVEGVQSSGVGACVKHYAVNSQETDRMRVSAEVSERALREIYLSAFEYVVRTARPAAVMASYNRVNGEYVTQSHRLLTETLREEWGFDGVVISDWGAVEDRVRALAAGLDLEMPGTGTESRDKILAAVSVGDLDEARVRASARRISDLARSWTPSEDGRSVRTAAHHRLSVEAAAAAMVLLSNDGTLPLDVDGEEPILVVGPAALEPRIQGEGSSRVGVGDLQAPWAAIEAATDRPVRYEPGYAGATGVEEDLGARVAEAAANARDVVLFVAGDAESEGYDRASIDLADEQIELIDQLVAANPRTVVVLNNGGVLAGGDWVQQPAALVEAWLPGEGYAEAVADVLFGCVNPAARMPETMPISIADTPAHLDFPGTGGRTFHGEGVFVGYRGYDRAGREVAFPFGHGLSYTTFEYRRLTAARVGDDVHVRFSLANTGKHAGAEVWQVYAEPASSSVPVPTRVLCGFGKQHLEPGDQVVIEVTVPWRAFARWDDRLDGWCVDGGEAQIAVGASSRDLRQSVRLHVDHRSPDSALAEGSTLREWLDHPVLGPALIEEASTADPSGATVDFITNPVVRTMIGDMPIRRLFGDPTNALSSDMLAAAAVTARSPAPTQEPEGRSG
ncbi:glycoside hydrolase family 3 C-terminal domain-containing protein [Nocardioides sp. NPDC101246]|uniref:glycoside hydrolase family 3 C-terminal domain-containing protein n=1 Tax=Nocardioides sp. NPDC101246 TaxID=3364336 RepID=UPI0037FB4C56